jgi:chaperonin GroES
MNLSNYEPLDDRILIKPDLQEDNVKGFLVADENKPKKLIGTVVAVGTGVPLHNIRLNIDGAANPEILAKVEDLINLIKVGRPLKVSVGERVIYGQFAGTRIPLEDGEYLMLRESDVFMRVNP